MASTILDAPSPRLRAIFLRRSRGAVLTPQEEREFQNRLHVEAEIKRTGGTVKQSIIPEKPKELTPGQKGAAEAQAAIDALRGRDATMRKNGFPGDPTLPPAPAGLDGAISATAKMRRSPITNDATDEQKMADNAAGPHIGADGQPATWNMPMRVAGRMNGSSFDSAAPVSAGGISMVGADGKAKIWKNGNFETPASGKTSAPSMAATPPADPAAAQRPISEDVAYIEKSGYGDFLNNPVAARSIAAKNFAGPQVVKPDKAQPSTGAAAQSADDYGQTFEKYGALGVAGRGVIDVAKGVGAGIGYVANTVAPAVTKAAIGQSGLNALGAVADAVTPRSTASDHLRGWGGQGGMMPRPSIAQPAPAIQPDAMQPQPLLADSTSGPNTPGYYSPSSITDIISRRAPAVARAASAVGSVLNPPTAAWNGPGMTGTDLATRNPPMPSIARPGPLPASATPGEKPAAIQPAQARSFRYDGEDPVQRQLRESSERSAAQQQAAKIADQAAQLDANQPGVTASLNAEELEAAKKRPYQADAEIYNPFK